MTNITLFAQIINKLDRHQFKKVVKRYQTDKHNKGINSWTHLVSMLFCHFAKANSLREIHYGLRSATGNLNHLGITNKCPSRSSLSYINAHRNWEMFREFYYKLLEIIKQEARFRQRKFKIRKRKILMLDSTTVSLCLSRYNWARFRQSKGAIKLHTLLEYEGCLPVYVHLSDGKTSDLAVAKKLELPSDSLVVADRIYLDFRMLGRWNRDGIKFVIRLKENVNYIDTKELPLPEGKAEHIIKDQYIRLVEKTSRENYNGKLRVVVVYDRENNQTIYLLTNQLTWTAETIAELYKQRWQIEIFFKELKQHLKIKTFVGTSPNAVLIQIWTALITMLILKYLKQISNYGWSLSNLVAFLRMNLFVKISLQHWLDEPFKPPGEEILKDIQMRLKF
jgi:hypothetical protein